MAVKLYCNKKTYTYDTREPLGNGSFGIVYKGIEEETNKIVAIKIMKDLNKDVEKEALKEIDIMYEIKKKCLPEVRNLFVMIEGYKHIQRDNKLIIIMEFCNSTTLQSYLRTNKQLDEKKAFSLLKQLTNALIVLRRMDLVHRDLKPANILLHYIKETKELTLKLADFGCAKQNISFHKSKLFMDTIIGTALYMSPQLLNRQSYTSKSDIWSLGIIYYEMLFGDVPWKANRLDEYIQIISRRYPIHFPAHVNNISIESKEFINSCLKYEENERLSWKDIQTTKLFQKHNIPGPLKRVKSENIIDIKNNLNAEKDSRGRKEKKITLVSTESLSEKEKEVYSAKKSVSLDSGLKMLKIKEVSEEEDKKSINLREKKLNVLKNDHANQKSNVSNASQPGIANNINLHEKSANYNLPSDGNLPPNNANTQKLIVDNTRNLCGESIKNDNEKADKYKNHNPSDDLSQSKKVNINTKIENDKRNLSAESMKNDKLSQFKSFLYQKIYFILIPVLLSLIIIYIFK